MNNRVFIVIALIFNIFSQSFFYASGQLSRQAAAKPVVLLSNAARRSAKCKKIHSSEHQGPFAYQKNQRAHRKIQIVYPRIKKSHQTFCDYQPVDIDSYVQERIDEKLKQHKAVWGWICIAFGHAGSAAGAAGSAGAAGVGGAFLAGVETAAAGGPAGMFIAPVIVGATLFGMFQASGEKDHGGSNNQNLHEGKSLTDLNKNLQAHQEAVTRQMTEQNVGCTSILNFFPSWYPKNTDTIPDSKMTYLEFYRFNDPNCPDIKHLFTPVEYYHFIKNSVSSDIKSAESLIKAKGLFDPSKYNQTEFVTLGEGYYPDSLLQSSIMPQQTAAHQVAKPKQVAVDQVVVPQPVTVNHGAVPEESAIIEPVALGNQITEAENGTSTADGRVIDEEEARIIKDFFDELSAAQKFSAQSKNDSIGEAVGTIGGIAIGGAALKTAAGTATTGAGIKSGVIVVTFKGGVPCVAGKPMVAIFTAKTAAATTGTQTIVLGATGKTVVATKAAATAASVFSGPVLPIIGVTAVVVGGGYLGYRWYKNNHVAPVSKNNLIEGIITSSVSDQMMDRSADHIASPVQDDNNLSVEISSNEDNQISYQDFVAQKEAEYALLVNAYIDNNDSEFGQDWHRLKIGSQASQEQKISKNSLFDTVCAALLLAVGNDLTFKGGSIVHCAPTQKINQAQPKFCGLGSLTERNSQVSEIKTCGGLISKTPEYTCGAASSDKSTSNLIESCGLNLAKLPDPESIGCGNAHAHGKQSTRHISSGYGGYIPTFIHGEYEPNPKHHQNSSGYISKPPKNGQKCLDESFPVENDNKKHGRRRVAIEDGHYVILSEHLPGKYHGHAIEATKDNWNQRDSDIKKAFLENNLVKDDSKGKIVK